MLFNRKGINQKNWRMVKKGKHFLCTAPQKLDRKNLTFGVFYYEIEL